MSADNPNAVDAGQVGPYVPTYDELIAAGFTPQQAAAYLGIDVPQAQGTQVAPRTASGGGGSYGAATQGQLLASQQQQASLAETIRQFNEQMGMDKARGDQQQRLAQQQADQRAAAEQQNYQLALRRFGLDQQTQDFNQYSKLADLASNPRNYVQTFFMNRGMSAPADVARYGNTNMNASQIVPFQQWQAQRGQAPAPAGPPPAAGYGGQNNPTNPYAGTNMNYGGSPTTADTAMINGVKTWAGGAYSGQPVASSPGDAGNLLPYLQQKPQMMARGGTVSMYVPHALVNLATGRTVAVAGERGLEHATFDGAAILDPNAIDPYSGGGDPNASYTDPFLGTPYATGSSSNTAPSSSPIGPTAPGETVPTMTTNPYDTTQTTSTAPTGTFTGTPNQTGGTTAPMPPSYSLTPQLLAQAQQLAQQANYANATRTTQSPVATARATAPGTIAPPPPAPVPIPSLTDRITPGATGGPVSYGQPISPQMPTYLAGENFQAASPITSAMQNLPFMHRMYGQARGDQRFGTNTTQQNNLPPDLPLMSHMEWTQLSPSEQQSFLSYVSSLGVDPTDYLNMIAQNTPGGGNANSPTFGARFDYSRQ